MNVREELKAYVDNELSAAEKQEMERALNASPELREELQWLQRAKAELAEWKGTPNPVGKEEALAKLANRSRVRPTWRTRPLAMVGYAATCLIGLAVLGAIIYPVQSQSRYAAKQAHERATRTEALMESESGYTLGGRSSEEAKSSAPSEEAVDGMTYSSPDPRSNGKGESDIPPQPAMPVLPDRPVESGRPANSRESLPMEGGASASKPIPEVGAAFGNHQIIFSGNIGLQVADAQVAVDKATAIARKLGGFAINSNVVVGQDAPSTATMTLRVPSKKFDTAILELKSLGKLLSANNTGQDVTAQIVDLDARIKTMKSTEEQYRQILRKAYRIGDVLDVQQRLGEIRAEIESLQAQSTSLKNLAQLATIELSLEEEPKPVEVQDQKPDDWATDAWNTSVNALNAFGRAVGRGVIALFVMSPVWIIPAAIAWWWFRKGKAV